MANRNTSPGIGENANPGVMHNPQPARAHTRARGMSYGDINNIPLSVIPRACAHAREENGKPSEVLAQWRTKKFGGDFDPVRVAVDEAVSMFSSRQPEDDRRIWLKIANHVGAEAFMDAVWQKRSEIGHDRILGGTDPSKGNAQAARCTGGVTANGWDRILSARLCVVSSYAMALRIRTAFFSGFKGWRLLISCVK